MAFNTSATIELLDKISPELRKIHNNFVAFDRKVAGLKQTFEALNRVSGLGNMAKGAQMAAANLTKVTLAATALTAATAAIAGAGVKSIIDTSAKFEKLSATLEAVEGSAAKAKAGLAWVQKFAASTPYELDQVSEAFVRARAYGIDPMDGSLKAAGDAASALGKPIMDAVEAMADALTGENERLKEFGIKASKEGDKITYSWSENGKRMIAIADANNPELIKKTVSGIWNRKYQDAMDKQSKTFGGMWSNLQDTITNFKKKIGDAGIFNAVKSQLGGLMEALNTPVVAKSLDNLAKVMSSKLVGLMKGIGFNFAAKDAGKFAEAIDKISKKIAAFDAEKFGKKIRQTIADIKAFVDKVGLGNIALAGLAVLFAPTIAGLGQIAYGFGKAGISAVKFATSAQTIEKVRGALLAFKNMGGIAGVFAKVGGSIKLALAPILGLGWPVIAIIAAIAAAGILIYKNWDLVASFFKGFWDGFIDAIKPVQAALEPLQPIFDGVAVAVKWVVKEVKGLFTQTKHTGKELEKAASIGQMFGQVVGVAINVITAPFRFVIWLAKSLGEGIAWLVIKFGELGSWASQKLDEISATIDVVTGFFSNKFNAALDFVKWLFESFKNTAIAKLKPIQDFLNGIINGIRGALESIGVLESKQAGVGNFTLPPSYSTPGVTAPIPMPKFPALQSPASLVNKQTQAGAKVDVHVSGGAKVDKVVTNGKTGFPLNPKAGLRS